MQPRLPKPARSVAFAALTATLASAAALAHDFERHEIRSKILGEARVIHVSQPRNAAEQPFAYPMLLALDGANHIQHLDTAREHLYQSGYPNLVIVALENTDRLRDMVFAEAAEEQPGGGGAADFLRFLETELLPFVESEFNVSGYRILFGHSASGGFGVYTLLERPGLFDAMLLATPNVHWAEFRLLNRFRDAYANGHLDRTSLVVTLANETGREAEGVRRLGGLLDARDNPLWSYTHYPTETHGSIPLLTGYFGLKTVFGDYFQSGDVRARPIPEILAYYEELGKRFEYDRRPPQRLLMDLGYQRLSEDAPEAALEIFDAFAEQYPGNPIALSGRSDALSLLGRHCEAAAAYDLVAPYFPAAAQKAEAERARAGADDCP